MELYNLLKLITQTNNASIFSQMNHEPDPSTGPWEVHTKVARKSRQGFEITVIRQNNIHGHKSWGWIDANKLLISSSGGPCRDEVIPLVWDKLVKLAQEVADELNAKEQS